MINSGDTFTYDLLIPNNESPGVYWYHPHAYGLSETAVLGGASGAIIVEGIQNVQPAVTGLTQRIMTFRDNLVPGLPTPGGLIPSWDLSLNYIPIPYPNYPTVVMTMLPNEKQLWRVVNAGAETILNLQLFYDGVAQPLQLVEYDGVPVNSNDATKQGSAITDTNISLPPSSRADFIVTGPGINVQNATLYTMNIDTGPAGDSDPTRPLATILATSGVVENLTQVPSTQTAQNFTRPQAVSATAKPDTVRTLQFSEVISDPNDPSSPTNFYITVKGATPQVFMPGQDPSITTYQGNLEDWVIENTATENHVFHIHQNHFLLLEENGVPVSADQQQYTDTIMIPYGTGTGPYPSVKIRMNFAGFDVGDFMYHCHILGHEDGGMMAVIRVLPSQQAHSGATRLQAPLPFRWITNILDLVKQ